MNQMTPIGNEEILISADAKRIADQAAEKALVRRLAAHCNRFRDPDDRRALLEVALTVVPFLVLGAAMIWLAVGAEARIGEGLIVKGVLDGIEEPKDGGADRSIQEAGKQHLSDEDRPLDESGGSQVQQKKGQQRHRHPRPQAQPELRIGLIAENEVLPEVKSEGDGKQRQDGDSHGAG